MQKCPPFIGYFSSKDLSKLIFCINFVWDRTILCMHGMRFVFDNTLDISREHPLLPNLTIPHLKEKEEVNIPPSLNKLV